MYISLVFEADLCIGAPVLQAVVGIATEDVQPLTGTDVPVTLLLDLLEHPRLDQSTPEVQTTTQESWPLHNGYSRLKRFV